MGADDDHLLVLWDWRNGVALCHVLTHRERLFGLRCAPWLPPPVPAAEGGDTAGGAAQDDAWVVAVGKGFARAYRAAELPGRHGTRLALPGRERSAALLSVGFTREGQVVVGSASGALHAFELATGQLVASARDAHAGPVHVLAEGPAGCLLSCGKDGRVRMWSADGALAPISSHPVLTGVERGLALLGPDPRLRALDWSDEAGLLLGTWASELLIVPPPGSADPPRLVTRGHAQHSSVEPSAAAAPDTEGEGVGGAARALAAPALGLKLGIVASGGDDAALRVWDLVACALSLDVSVAAPISALAFDPSSGRPISEDGPGALSEDGPGSISGGAGSLSGWGGSISGARGLRLAVGYADGTWEVNRLDVLRPGASSLQASSHPGSSHAASPRAASSAQAASLQASSPAGPSGPSPCASVAAAPLLSRGSVPKHPRRITQAAFSPSGQWLALGCADATIYLHDVAPISSDGRCEGGVVARCLGHSSVITQIDWTVDSYVVRSNCNG